MLHRAEAVMQVPSYAKVNWLLRVVGKRDDGFHDIETVYQTISLHDTLTFSPSDQFTLTCSDPTIPTDDTNLVARAARALGVRRIAIHIEKRIPAGGGLGGGSSNAAATLVALSKMFDVDAPLYRLALDLGSDVPFFLAGGRAHATGRGEMLTQIPDPGPVPLLLVLPIQKVMTKDAFTWVRPSPAERGITDPHNDFEEPVFKRFPKLREYKQRLLDAGATFAAMSGSGSTIFGAFGGTAMRDAARERFADVRTEAAECVGRA
jgi:4-diphosphocytidyl-2-C-methyl-D-erythritol kinase